ncbi:hypothetical protein [Chryseobacterium echinoideorum]|uniref:hypothetical protein n=1 Tax=Chryseobacterium echinoideorum TaxID=1549648 RepID=UPI0011857F8D|nr:hypothetical protein [Chryseobacterium echinoideorum]
MNIENIRQPFIEKFPGDFSGNTMQNKFNENDLYFLAATHLPDYIKTYSTAYAGHKFGNWASHSRTNPFVRLT